MEKNGEITFRTKCHFFAIYKRGNIIMIWECIWCDELWMLINGCKECCNKFDGPKSIIKPSNNNLKHNYMFSVIYKLGKMTSFAIFLFQLWAFTNGVLAYTCLKPDLMQKAAFIKSYNIIRLLRKKRGYLTSIERKKGV